MKRRGVLGAVVGLVGVACGASTTDSLVVMSEVFGLFGELGKLIEQISEEVEGSDKSVDHQIRQCKAALSAGEIACKDEPKLSRDQLDRAVGPFLRSYTELWDELVIEGLVAKDGSVTKPKGEERRRFPPPPELAQKIERVS